MDLTLDYTPGHSSFYSDNTFVRDSIGLIAFNGQGGIKDDEAYGKLVRLPGTTSKDVVLYGNIHHRREYITFPEEVP